jgi:hypothetical protein
MYALVAFTKLLVTSVVASFAWAGLWTWRLTTAPFRVVYWFFKSLFLAMAAMPKILWRLPLRAYRSLMRGRNWLLDKVEYLQAESAKWKTTFNVMKSPYLALRGLGFTPQMAASLLIGASAVTGGVVVNETVFAEKSFARGDSGVYSNGGSDIPTSWSEGDNTLRIKLGTTPVKAVTISDVSVGTAFTGSTLPSGATTTIDIGGSGVTDTWLEVGTLVFERNRCEVLTLSNINAHTLNITSNASDGQSLSPAAGTIRNRAVLGGHGMAQDMSTTGGLYDRIVIEAPTSSVNGQIDTLTLSNIYTKGGLCRLNRIKAGTVTVHLNVTGGDSNLSTKAFTVMDDVTASVVNLSGNVEVSMAVPATQSIDQ